MAKVKPIPDGYQSVIPYLIVDGAGDAIDWYTKSLGAKEMVRMGGPGGKVGHAELQFGDSVVMLADEFPDMGIKSPKTIGGSPVNLCVYLEDVDATFDDAVKGGAKVLQPVEDKFYGDRSGQIEDPFGHIWSLMTHVEDVSPEEMERRMAEQMPPEG
jgi:PhnB protein